MAYKQKNNPFKQKVSIDTPPKTNQNNLDLAKRLNKMRFEMGHIYPITSEREVRGERQEVFTGQGKDYWEENPHLKEKSVEMELLKTAQTEQERKELYNIDPTGRGDVRRTTVYGETESGEWGQIGTKQREVSEEKKYAQDLRFIKTAKEAGGEVFNKIMSLPKNTIVDLQNDLIKVGRSFAGKKLGEDPVATLNEVKKLDLSGFKTYLTKADISVNDIRKIVTAQLNNLPDLDKDGTPDVFEGIFGNVLRTGINTVVDMKLKSLK